MNDSAEDRKREARRAAEAAAAAVPPPDRAAAGEAIARSLIELPQWLGAGVVMLYRPLGSEPDLSLAIDAAIDARKRVLLPRSLRETASIEAVPLPSRDAPLKRDPLGVPAPVGPPADPRSIDLVVVPGVAFDLRCVRLGRGGGYYDRFLASLAPECLRVGVCLDCRVLERVPAEPHDLAMDLLLTERRRIDRPS